MPAIHLFGRRTVLGGDDLQLPCFFAMSLRSIQLLGFLIPIWWHIGVEAKKYGSVWNYIWYDQNYNECRTSHMMPLLLVIYSILSTIVAVFLLIWESRLYRASSRGCPTETQPRSKQVEGLLEFQLLPVGIVQCLLVILGIATMCFAKEHYDCSHISPSIALDEFTAEDYAQDDDFWKVVTATRMHEDNSQDPALLWWIAFAFLWVSHLLESVFVMFAWKELLRRPPASSPVPDLHHDMVEELWNERCASFCECLGRSTCFLFGGRNMSMGNYGEVARALADYLETGGTLDLVPSDIVMGFMILRKIQRQRILQARSEVNRENSLLRDNSSSMELDLSSRDVASDRQSFYVMHQEGSETFYESTSRKVLNINKTLDRHVLQEGARFSRYQLAIYTWVLYLYGNPTSGLPKLLAKSRCGCCRSHDSDDGDEEHLMGGGIPSNLAVGDNCCKTNKAALMLVAGIDDSSAELIYAHFHSSFSEIPYCIIVDHDWKSVVLAIRGTFSLEDCVTDVLIEPVSLRELGEEFGFDGHDQHCHGGVMTSARIVYRDLLRHGLLDKLLLGDAARFPGYNLRIVGHSLGAGAATLLSYMLRRKFAGLRCINYSPPGCTLTWRMATECSDWCTTFVLDSDLVPRLSVQTLEHLRDEVIDLVGRVKVPKVEVAKKTLPNGFLCQSSARSRDMDELADLVNDLLLDPHDIPPDSQYQLQLGRFKAIQAERRSSRGHLRSIMMYPPGRCVHFMKTSEKPSFKADIVKLVTCCTTNLGSEYTPVWIENNDFNEIVVSPTMATDHFPNRLTDVMLLTARMCGLDTTQPCTFDGEGDTNI